MTRRRSGVSSWSIGLAAAATCGCVASRAELESRAANDLACSELRMVELEGGGLGGRGRLYGVEGCGRHASYRYDGSRWLQVTGLRTPPKKAPDPSAR